MKKTLAFIASLVLMTTAFVSCGDKDDDDDDSTGRGSKSSSSVDRSDDDKKSSKKDKDDDDDDNDIIGTWIPDDTTMAGMFADIGDEFDIESMTFEITENEIKVDATIDMSGLFCIQDDQFVIYGEYYDYDYDGKVISITYMDEVITEFDRVGKADKKNVYGKYTCDDMFDIDPEEGEIYFDFSEDNVAYMFASAIMECSYDEETGKLTVTDMDGEAEDMDVEISGKKMYMISEDGERIGFKRK